MAVVWEAMEGWVDSAVAARLAREVATRAAAMEEALLAEVEQALGYCTQCR